LVHRGRRRAPGRSRAEEGGSCRRSPRLAATGRAGDAEIDAELDRDRTDQGRRLALACRAAIPDAAHKARAWRLLSVRQRV